LCGSEIPDNDDHGMLFTVTIDVPGMVQNGRTLVQLRFVTEAFGADVSWDSSARVVTIMSG